MLMEGFRKWPFLWSCSPGQAGMCWLYVCLVIKDLKVIFKCLEKVVCVCVCVSVLVCISVHFRVLVFVCVCVHVSPTSPWLCPHAMFPKLSFLRITCDTCKSTESSCPHQKDLVSP